MRREDREKNLSNRFNCTPRDRAVFEAGIKLATIYHQYIGTPVSMKNVASLEKAIREATLVQPYVKDAEVRIKRESLGTKSDEYDYSSLSPEMLSVRVVVEYGGYEVEAKMEYLAEEGYPLMYVSRISGERM